MPTMQKVGSHKTSIRTEGNQTFVRYHYTDVVIFSHSEMFLNSGGWQTVTTKARMNQASNQFGLGFVVSQKDFEWFVEFKGQTLPFVDGMSIPRLT